MSDTDKFNNNNNNNGNVNILSFEELSDLY
jgi:hypothetical protein